MDHKGKEIVVIGPSSNNIKGRVFLTKPDVRGNMDRARVVELINMFDDKLDKDSLRCKFKIEFEKRIPLLVRTPILTTSCLIMIYWTTLKEKATLKTATIGDSERF